MADIKLTDEERNALNNAEDELQKAAKAIENLEALGVDVSALKTRLAEANTIRVGLLENF